MYKPSNGYKIHKGAHLYMFREVISEFEGLLVQLNWTSAENAAEGYPLLNQTLQTSTHGTASLHMEERHTGLLPPRVVHVDRHQSGQVTIQCGYAAL